MFAVIFSAVYAKRTEVALGICSILFVLMPTYFVHNFEIPFNNWLLGSVSPMSASKGEVLSAVWSSSPNTSRFDELLGLPALGLRLGLGSGLGLGLGLGLGSGPLALTVRGRAYSTLIEMARAAVRGGGFMT